jgi:hypothetical protein
MVVCGGGRCVGDGILFYFYFYFLFSILKLRGYRAPEVLDGGEYEF